MNPNNIVKLPESKRVGIWIRVSTEDQARGESPQTHELRAREYARFNDWTVAEIYDLSGKSGKSVMAHPETKRMLADIKRGHISGLIFSKLARLARNKRELEDFADLFRQSSADMISLQEKIDTSTPAGRFFYSLLAALAHWEREEITDRVAVAVLARAKAGKPLNNSAPYGYHWKDKKLTLHPQEAPVRKLAYELFAQHRRKGAVARILNERGYRTRNGHPWRDMTIGRLLHCPSAKGTHRTHFTKRTGESWAWEERPEHEHIHLPVEPIVSEELWTQCNRLLEEQQKKKPGKQPAHTFAGLTYCGCGAKMYVPSSTPKYCCFRKGCGNKIPVADLEAIFYEELKAFFLKPERIASHLQAAAQNVAAKESLLEIQKKDIERIREEINKTHKLYLAGQIPLEGFKNYYDPLQERLTQLQTEQAKLEAEVAHLTVNHVSADEVMNEAQALYSRWSGLATESKRKIVESITEKIVIGTNNEIEITLSYLPSSEEVTKSQQRLPLLVTDLRAGSRHSSTRRIRVHQRTRIQPKIETGEFPLGQSCPRSETNRRGTPSVELGQCAGDIIGDGTRNGVSRAIVMSAMLEQTINMLLGAGVIAGALLRRKGVAPYYYTLNWRADRVGACRARCALNIPGRFTM